MASPVYALFQRIRTSRRRTRRLAVIAAFTGMPLQFIGYETFGQGRMGDRSRLDERQRAMNDRALVLSYGVVTTVVTLALGAIWLAAAFVGPVVIQMDATSLSVAVAIGLYLPLLPFASLSWIEPDAPADDVP